MLHSSHTDLAADFEELEWLADDAVQKLAAYIPVIRKQVAKPFPAAAEEVIEATQLLLGDLDKLKRDIHGTRRSGERADDISRLTEQKYQFLARLRALISRTGSLLVATDWQSPTFAHTLYPLAGSQTGKISATINDYKRDLHWDAQFLEDAFKREYIDGIVKLPINVYATVSGMAAATTIMNYLQGENRADGPILVGQRTYFEAKDLLHRFFGARVRECDEFDTHATRGLIRDVQPAVLWLDSLSNTEEIGMPQIGELFAEVAQSGRNPTTVVLDNTGLSVSYQPLHHALIKPKNVNLVVFESLNKYYQFGLDRTTGGIIWSVGGESGKLSDYRVHTGTNIPDMSAQMIPTPNRKRLERRLARFERNTMLLATHLDTVIRSSGRQDAVEVVYPGLPSYRGYAWTRGLPFHGSYLTLSFREPYRRVSFYKQFVERALRKAKSEQIALVSGTSFGLDITRLYLTAIRATVTTPFLRVAVGTEHQADLLRIGRLLGEVITTTSA